MATTANARADIAYVQEMGPYRLEIRADMVGFLTCLMEHGERVLVWQGDIRIEEVWQPQAEPGVWHRERIVPAELG